MKKRFFIMAVMLILALGLVACGEDSKSSKKSKKETTSESDEKKEKKKKDKKKEETEDIADDVNEGQADMYEGDEEEPAKEEPAESYEEVVFEGPENKNVQFCEIPEGTTKVADKAFQYCHNLDEVTIPNSVKEIGKMAFAGCEKLTSITLPDGLESIGNGAFFGNNNLTITIPSSVTSIDEYAFFETGCVRVPQSVLERLGVREEGFRESYAGTYGNYEVEIEIIN